MLDFVGQDKYICCKRCHRLRQRWGCTRSRPIPADVAELKVCPDPDHRQHVSICQRCHDQLNPKPIRPSVDTTGLATLANVASSAAISSQSVLSVPQTPCNTPSSSPPSPQSLPPPLPPAPTDALLSQICDRLRSNDFSVEWSRDYERVLNRLIHCAPKKGRLIPCRGKRGPPQYIQLVTHTRKPKNDRSQSHNKRLQTEINIGKRLHKDPIHDTHNDSDKLTPNQSLGVVNDLGLNGKQARRYRHIMKTTGTTSVISSEYAIMKVLDERNWQFESDTFRTIVKTQVKNAKKGEKKYIEKKVDVPYTRMVNVSVFLTQQFDELIRQGILMKDGNGRYRLLLSGDKGGQSTKLGLSFIRQEKRSMRKIHVCTRRI